MSRCRTRARNERALNEGRLSQKDLDHRALTAKANKLVRKLRAAASVDERVEANRALISLIEGIADSDLPVWSFLPQLIEGDSTSKLAAEERAEVKALIAQVVAPRLAGMTPGSVKRRQALAEDMNGEAT
jgi:hypothetical protein